ncbi:MAG: formylglycine-generating enzyme family protein [Prevotellaceae bacterium]|jgi:formylglycine-generating enzyme required for sulfatase activity|nr:formylglycine-generating enzyme family protein [Prevotellaceae bacterium]
MKKVVLLAAIAGVMFFCGGSSSDDESKGDNNNKRKNGEVYSSDGIEMVYVEGSGTVKGFYIGKYEVTQAQYQAIMGANPSYFKGDNRPVEMVSWNDAQKFIKKLNTRTGKSYRLPTEAEWEYAAREGTKKSSYRYSGSDDIDEVAWYGDYNNSSGTHPVGQKIPNALGIYDMSGNVWEWCQDCYDNSCSDRVYRGGSWYTYAVYCRVAYRLSYAPGGSYGYLGFRLALP